MLGVVAADRHHLAARDHRGQQPDGVEFEPLAGQLDRHRDRIPGERGHRVGVRSSVVGQFDDAELGIATGGETGNAHCVSRIRALAACSKARRSAPYSPTMTNEPHDIVELIIAKRDGHELDDDQIDWLIHAIARGAISDEQMSALSMAVFFRGLTPSELRPLDRRHDRHRRPARLLRPVPTHRRQALDRRGRRQDHPAVGAAGRGLRRRCSPALRPGTRVHGRHARQAGVHPRLAGRAQQRRDADPARRGGGRHLRRDAGPGPGGQEAVRAARRHRHRRGRSR